MSYLRYVKIIGTVHVSPESVREVRETIIREKPDAIALELDYPRLLALLRRERLTLPQALKLGKMGIFGFILQELEMFFGRSFGESPGEEMIEAYKAAASLGIPVYLIDKPVNETLAGMLSSPPIEKLRFGIEVLASLLPGKLKELDYSYLMKEFREKFPHMYKVLVEERNLYMAINLMRIVDSLLEKKKKVKYLARRQTYLSSCNLHTSCRVSCLHMVHLFYSRIFCSTL